MSSNESKYINTKVCVPQNTLIAYLRGSLTSVEMNAVERHLSGCPMCSDELEGLALLPNPNSISSISNSINRKVDSFIAKQNKSIWESTTFRVAASVAMLFAISGLIYYTASLNTSHDILSDNIPANEAVILEEVIGIDSMEENQPKADVLPKSKSERVIVYDVDDEIALELEDVNTPKQTQQRVNAEFKLAESAQSAGAQQKKLSPPPAPKVASISIVAEDNVDLSKEEFSADLAVRILNFVSAEEEYLEEEEIFTIVEEMPTFAGGDISKFRDFISKNLKYPDYAAENGIQGRVFVGFVVERDGSVSNVKVIRGVDPLLDKEAVRVVKSSPKWTPGKQRGVPVRVTFTFPVVFSLQ
jgi:periplasmic protein TonB